MCNLQKLFGTIVLLFLLVSSSLGATRTFTVEETDFVKIRPQTADPDNDPIFVYYSPPLNDQGEWQTGYDDAGEYDLTITASDGREQTVETVKLIVKEKNREPFVNQSKITALETELLDLKKYIIDPDGDALEYTFNSPFDRQGTWQTGYDDAGMHLASFTADDGEITKKGRIEIEILSKNQPPELIDSFSKDKTVLVTEDSTLEFWAEVRDGDGDVLSLEWKIDNKSVGNTEEGEYYFDFESAGEHDLLLEMKDNEHLVQEQWTIIVGGVNRKPALNFLPITVKEGEKVTLDLEERDEDGDLLFYSFEEPFTDQGEWQTGYNDAGSYTTTVEISDGDTAITENVRITVLDVDREPELIVPKEFHIREGEALNIEPIVSDPDGDAVTVSFSGLPPEAIVKNNTVLWNVPYDALARKGGFLSDLLNSFRLEHFFLKKKVVPITINGCSKDVCSSAVVEIVVYNTNRMPEFNLVENMKVQETDLVQLNVQAVDPDNDIIHHSFTDPLGKRSGNWQTGYEDQENYTIYATASDGRIGSTVPVTLEVTKKNRIPTLQIKDDEVIVNEGQQFLIDVKAQDPDNDSLEVWIENLPLGASFIDNKFLWEPSYDRVTNGSWDSSLRSIAYFNKKFNPDQDVSWATFVASDGEAEVRHPVKIAVKDVNRKPEILSNSSPEMIAAYAGQPVFFEVVGNDPDQQQLQYTWKFGFGQQIVKGTNKVERIFTVPGEKKIDVTVSDGIEKITKKWIVNVLPVEQKAEPVILEPVTVKVYVIEG